MPPSSPSRHKSGVALRFPRINRIRWDKPANEAATLDEMQVFLGGARMEGDADVDGGD